MSAPIDRTARTARTGRADRTEVTVVGGGLAGLIAAIEVAEAGVPVRLLEARRRLGGRGTSSPGRPGAEPPGEATQEHGALRPRRSRGTLSPQGTRTPAVGYTANLGPHALYDGTELWSWLRARDLHGPARTPRSANMVLRWQGAARRTPPRALIPALRLRGGTGATAPVDVDLRTWATDRWGPDTAAALAGLGGPLTFDHDPGRLSAAFVVERIRRILLRPRVAARYVEGGWSALVDRVAAHARSVGVAIEVDAGVSPSDLADLRDRGPVVVAVEPGAARRLLGDAVPPPDDRRVALLDVGLVAARDPYLVIDLDEAIFWARASAVVPDVAPAACDLVQLSAGMAPGEELDAAVGRIEALLDLVSPGWRDRVEWRRRSGVRGATGAVDLPGTTWRDRPAVDQGDGLWLAGDWVAAPGHLAEVSCVSARIAAAGAVHAASRLSSVLAR